jgi:hypothetical protein
MKKILSGVLMLLSLSSAHGYIDPGTGSYLFQLLIGGLLGSFYFLGSYWTGIKTFFKRMFAKK